MKSKTYLSSIILKYIAKKYFITVILASIVLLAVFILVDSLEMVRKLSSEDVASSVIREMILLKLPTIYLEILPFSVLIGSLLCFSSLAKTSELVAIRSSGVSAWQFLMPSALIALLIGVTGIAFINPLAAATQKKYEAIEQEIYPDKEQGQIINGQELWLKYGLDNSMFILHADSVVDRGLELNGVSIYFYDKKNSFIKRIESDKAELMVIGDGYYWFMENAEEIKQGSRVEKVQGLKVPTQMTPEKIQYSFSSANTISVYNLPDFINSLESAGFSTLEHKVRLLNILFLPLLCWAMFCLAAPFALHFSRKGGIGKLLLSGLCFGFVFYIFNNIITTLAQAGRLNIYIAVIIPILIAALIGLYMLLHFREE